MKGGSAGERVFNLSAEVGLRILGKRTEVRDRTVPDVELSDALLQLCKKFVINGSFHVSAFDRNTYAPGVGKGAVNYAFNGSIKIAVSKDDARVFAAKLEDRRDQVLRRTLGDLLTVSAAAGEEDEVRTGVDEGGGLFGTVVQHLHQITRQICLRADPRDESGCFRRPLGTLENHRISGDERCDERDCGKL